MGAQCAPGANQPERSSRRNLRRKIRDRLRPFGEGVSQRYGLRKRGQRQGRENAGQAVAKLSE